MYKTNKQNRIKTSFNIYTSTRKINCTYHFFLIINHNINLLNNTIYIMNLKCRI